MSPPQAQLDNTLFHAVSRWLGRSPRIATFLRYALPILVVTAATELIQNAGLPRPAPGILSMLIVLACAWFGGLGPALALSPVLFLIARMQRGEAMRWAPPGPQEIVAMTFITCLCASMGLAGQYRRRYLTATRQHARKLREQSRALAQASILFRTVDGTITQWNEGIERLFGWTSGEAIGCRVDQLLQSEFPAPAEDIEAELVEHGQWHGEVKHRHKDGNELHVAAHWILYRDEAGQPVGVAEVHNDVTELRRAEAAIREADRRKDEFLAMLAHELRNPLAPIRTGLELIRTSNDDPQLLEQTRRIMERQMRQLVTLVDDLLDVSRISRGKLELRRRPVALSEVVDSAVEAVRPALKAAGHSFHVCLPEQPVRLDVDPHRLAQVVSNVLDNAIKYTPPGGNVSLTAQCREGEVVLSVEDDGLGIAPEMLERIFDMFTQSETTAALDAGLGIGLALVKSIVEMHGGRVEASSAGEGRGARMQIVLPLPAQGSIDSPQRQTPTGEMPTGIVSSNPPAAAATGKASSSDSQPASRRVLIVDDNDASVTLLSLLVKNFGNDVRVARDGEEALDVARQFQPEIVFMDLGMPKLDGYGACRLIRQEPWGQQVMLVALTGWGQDAHRQRTKEAGFDYHLVKPADPNELRRLLSQTSPDFETALN